jgi:hypothetical protein
MNLQRHKHRLALLASRFEYLEGSFFRAEPRVDQRTGAGDVAVLREFLKLMRYLPRFRPFA